ncbi:hypothetical protein ACROYT_G031254 [Oculina patagonica]
MSLASNTTILIIRNGTAHGQQNSSCLFVDSTAEKISKVCAYCFLWLGSFFGNVFIIIIVYKHRDLRKTINYFIVNMAVSDLLFPLIVIPVQITELLTGSEHWHVSGILESIICKLHVFAAFLSINVSAQSLVWIAIDRSVAVVFPLKRGLISTKVRTVAIVSTWIVAGLFNFPVLITFGLVEQRNDTLCAPNSKESPFNNQEAIAAYGWLRTTFFAIAPFFLITILYTAIAIALKRQNKALAGTALNVQQQSLKKRRQAIQMSVVIVVLFYICVIPFIFFHFVLRLVKPSCALLRLFYFLAFFMYYSTCTINPVICLSFVQSYRRRLRNILCPCSKIWNSEMAKQEKITLEGMKDLSKENCQGTLKDTENNGEILVTVL